MVDSRSDPMQSFVARIIFFVAGALLGSGLYVFDISGLVAVPVAMIGLLVFGELSLFVAGGA
jgi:hypothetical protein